MSHTAEIIAVGTEILLGNIANTDAQMLSQSLSTLGVNVFWHTVVGDNPQRLKEALDIARRALGAELDGKTILPLQFAMSRDAAVLRASHETAASAVRPFLDAGQDVAMLNLGDVSIYATFGYLQEILQAQGYATAMAAGVPSFCAAAARLNQPLTGGMDAPLTIAPGSWADEVLDAPGTKVLMKTGRQLPALLDTLDAHGALSRSALVCSCGLPDETIFPDLSTARPPQDGSKAGYFATVLVKE